jgi:hypothetical protein
MYETHEIKKFPPKQKLQMLQNTVGDDTEFSYVKQLSVQDVARGNLPLAYKGYMEWLFLACSTYDKKLTLPGKQKRAVYRTTISNNDKLIPSNETFDGEYEVFMFDTDISKW